MGEAIQKARTGANGTPLANRAATRGITPQEQKGDSAPTMDAITTAFTGFPEKASAMSWSAPLAFK